MTQKTKEELKNQSSALFETESTYNADLIDTFATMHDIPKEYEYVINTHSDSRNSDYQLYVHRFGNLVHIEGRVATISEKSSGISIKNGYRSNPLSIGEGYVFFDDGSFAGDSTHVTLVTMLPGNWIIMNDTEKELKPDSELLVNITYVTTDPFPDDSELVNPNPIPDKE